MRAVNLLPRDEAPKSFEARRGVAFGAAGGTALVTVILAAAMISAGGAASAEQSRLDSLNAEMAALPQPEAAGEDGAPDAALVAEKSARITALSTALGNRIAWDRVLRQVSQVLPKDVWLTSISGFAPVKPKDGAALPEGASTSPTLTLAGSTYSVDGVARVLARLAVTPALSSAMLESTTIQAVGTRKIVQFTILADVRMPGGAS